MNFDKLILPPVSIAALYPRSLIEDSNDKQFSANTTEKGKVAGYAFLGKNESRVCLLVNIGGEEIIPKIHLQFITRMLEACKMSMDDVAVLNHSHEKIEIKKLKQQLNPVRIILFGIPPAEIGLPINFPFFKPQAYDAVSYLYTPPLIQVNQENEEGKLLKSKLWVCLRQLFQV